MRQQFDRLLKLILVLTAFTMITVWLPLVRGLMDGETYQWGHSLFGIGFGGSGVDGYYWLLALEGVFSVALIYLGWRGARQPFHWLLLARNMLFAASAFYSAISFPEQYRFRGDTLGVDVSLAWVAPLFWGVLLLLSIIWVVRDLRRIEPRIVPPWNRTNTILLAITLSLIPLQFVLLRFGEPHGTTDKIGVILTMLQWVLLNVSFGKWRSKELVGVQTAALR